MKNILFLGLFAVAAISLAGCGSAANTTGNANAAKPNSNVSANSAANTSTADSTPMPTSIKELGDKKLDELEKLKGRTLVFKGEGLWKWDEESLTAKAGSRGIVCKGDFSSYKDAIKAFDPFKTTLVDFKGVVDEVEDVGSAINLKLKGCSIQNLDK